jgi:Protein of unknown function (DUF1553)/Protein of unknown function (DUF1549)/Planctomycete cytochrome C
MRPLSAISLIALLLTGVCVPVACAAEDAQKPAASTKEGVEFFEKFIRPVLAERCYECHSAQARKLKGKLLLDSQAGIAKGGENGAVLVPGDVEKSRLIKAIRWTDPDLVMPPKDKLTPQQIERFEQWVKMGAPDPRAGPASGPSAAAKTIDFEAGRKWWAFRPVAESQSPAVKQQAWAKKKVDYFVLRELEANQLAPSGRADPRALIQRVYLDLTGLRPSYEQSEAFARDPSDEAYEQVVEQLLASPQYGERWGRYWLDVARYGEDNPTSEATNPPYPFAWRYRDWVIGAVGRDVPYNQFVTLQLAADLMPKTPRSDLAATGFLGAGPIYHKDGRLSKDVIENLYMDDWDERVDAVSRGVLGLTVACARCHDHKFDPVATRDYYALAGVFASTVAVPRPIADVDPQAETRFMVASQRLFYLSYTANLLRGDPGSKPKEARQKVERFVGELDKIEAEIASLRQTYPELYAHLARLDKRPDPYPGAKPATPAVKEPAPPVAGGQRRRRGGGSTEPFFNAVFDAGLWVNGADADLTMLDVKPGEPHDLRVLPGGNVAKPGELVPRGFPTVLAKGDPAFHHGSGRLELAEKIFTDAAPLSARVIVNRVWAWHFGKPLVDTPSDFGAQGEKPTHPQLLDDLAARFIANGWSLKWLHREMLLSSAYQQSSHPRQEAMKIDPVNRLLWRMNPRRLDIEAYRDCILQATGSLDTTAGGPSTDVDVSGNNRRTVYARISRGRLNNLLRLYGFPEATMHSPNRETTTTPLQQLFVMNSPFLRDQGAALSQSVAKELDVNSKVRAMYRKALARDPSDRELALAVEYLATGTITDYAHALLCTNEVIFWP